MSLGFLKSSSILVFWFLLFGPGIGGYTLAQLMGSPSTDDPGFPNLFLFSYIVGLVPAFIAAIFDGILLWSYKGREEEISLSFAVLLGGLSGVLVALCFGIFFDLWSGSRSVAVSLGFIAVFAVPGAVCGIFNKTAWRQLSP
ncbi:hypothetical protein [Marinobacter bohaiensis]|uniref:hypothetical protein n=1 Tax=Marinobacter bohaiensis TaxID=2201898 RepID=UPI000DACF425|nr:hypothetical protein [Marinobacter bohaiensis]